MNPIIRSVAHTVISIIHRVVGYLIPIDKNKVFFDSFPDYSDNCRALSDYLIKYTDYRIYWAVNQIPQNGYDKRVHFVLKHNKCNYIYHTLSSRYLFSTHSAFAWAIPKRNIYTCLWHGTPAKKICLLQNSSNIYYLRNCTFFTAASDYAKGIYINAFGRAVDDILVTGYPRCDLLFQESDSLIKLGIEKSDSDRLILYLPTFRQPIGASYSDSSKNIYEDDFIIFSDPDDIYKWNEFFKQKNILFIVKPHPSDSNIINFAGLSNIRVISNNLLQENDVQLYSLMHYADAIVTDFSSVYFDYLLLNRPIGFIISDIDEFKKNRGSIVENPLEIMPGHRILSKEDFIIFCQDVISGNDNWISERTKIQSLFNLYIDGNACERVVKELKMNNKITER